MRVRVDEIPDSGRTLSFRWDQEMLDRFVPPDDPFHLKLPESLQVELFLDKRTDHLTVTGTIQGALEVGCHRCLRPFLLPVDEKVDIYLVTEGRGEREDEKELEADELLYEFFDGEVIEVDELVAEQIFLGLPVKVLCSEDCRGICPGCGANLNEEACRCKADHTSRSPFAKLEVLKKKQPEE
ncbi:MAG: YceD family protein [Syntrophobacteraceae bacterium]